MWWLDKWAIFIMRSMWAVGFHSLGRHAHTCTHIRTQSWAAYVQRKRMKKRRTQSGETDKPDVRERILRILVIAWLVGTVLSSPSSIRKQGLMLNYWTRLTFTRLAFVLEQTYFSTPMTTTVSNAVNFANTMTKNNTPFISQTQDTLPTTQFHSLECNVWFKCH